MIQGALLQESGTGRLEAEISSLAAGLAKLGIPVGYFLEKHLQRRQVKLNKNVLVAGHIPVVLGALGQLGIDPPVPDDYPDCLRPWMRRRVWTSTVGDVVTKLQEGVAAPFFAKPIGRHKRFSGHVFASWDDLRALRGASDQLRVICSEVVHFRSEYRVYVVRGAIVGVRHYRGDSNVSLDRASIEDAVSCFERSRNAPAGYGIDFCVLRDGSTALVEVNDGYSLGSYGLEDRHYTDLIAARWEQLIDRGY